MLTVKYMMVNGFKIKSMVLVNIDGQMEQFTKVSGIMIKEKVKVKKHYPMDIDMYINMK